MNRTVGSRSWSEIIGPVFREDILPEDLKGEPGVIRLSTKSNTVVYPERQFPRIDGVRQPVPEFQKAVLLLEAEDLLGSGFSPWTHAAYLLGPRPELGEDSYIGVLGNPDATSETKYQILGKLMTQISNDLRVEGLDSEKLWEYVFEKENQAN